MGKKIGARLNIMLINASKLFHTKLEFKKTLKKNFSDLKMNN